MKFFRTFIAATLGTLLALLILVALLLITISSSAEEPEPYIRDNTVLKINIRGDIPARQVTDPFEELFSEAGNDKVSLETLKENLSKAATHDKIKGVWLEIDFVGTGWANLQEAHNLISTFRDSTDKFVYASTNDIGFNEQGYFIATAADSVFSPPESFFEFDGFYSQVMFLTGLFEKLGINVEVTRHGKFKGAVEPFFRTDLSEENEYQLRQLIDGVSSTFVNAVSAKTGKSPEELNQLLNNSPSLLAESAYANGLIDALMYPDQVRDLIKTRIGLEESASLRTVSNNRYQKVGKQTAGQEAVSSEDKIAVIHATGPIMPELSSGSPMGGQQLITAQSFQKQLEEIREDDDVKALVVRINSPGGSASTSDAIWRMLQETKEQMPVIVSMGPVAASGGYYIAMAADTIVAEPTTITGSIGVFGTKFNIRELLNEELGVSLDGVKSHEHADWLDPTRGFTPSEEKAFQQFIDRTYQTFIGKVAEARGMTVQQVDEIAQGRVWIGADAKEQNLIDVLGGLETSLAIAAEKAGIEEYDIVTFPEQKNLYELLMTSAETRAKTLLKSMWFDGSYLEEATSRLALLQTRGPLLLMPYEIVIQ